MKNNPFDDDPKYAVIREKVDKEAMENVQGIKEMDGTCHVSWSEKKTYIT